MVFMYTITKDTLIGDIMDHAPEISPLFYSIGMHCLTCPSSRAETLDEACQVHGVNTDDFLQQVFEWQKTCQDDPEAAAQMSMLYSMFGSGDLFSGADYWGAYDEGGSAVQPDGWSAIDDELASFGILPGYGGFSPQPDDSPDSTGAEG